VSAKGESFFAVGMATNAWMVTATRSSALFLFGEGRCLIATAAERDGHHHREDEPQRGLMSSRVGADEIWVLLRKGVGRAEGRYSVTGGAGHCVVADVRARRLGPARELYKTPSVDPPQDNRTASPPPEPIGCHGALWLWVHWRQWCHAA
jgi:hypothetical protein